MNAPKFKWVAESDDDSFHDESETEFDSQEECYQDMRDAVLEKMKWNTEWEDIIDDTQYRYNEHGVLTTPTSIGYEVVFAPDHIVHVSYSGTYTYKIITC